MLRLLTGSRAALAGVAMAILALAACSSSSPSSPGPSGSSAGSSPSEVSKTLPTFDPTPSQLAATIDRILLGPVNFSSLQQVVQYALKMNATPLTAAQTAWVKACLSEQICHTGHGLVTLAMPSQDVENTAERITEGEIIWAAAHFPQIKEVIRSNAGGDLSTYLSNFKAAITQGANIIVTDTSFFGSSMLPVVQEAKAHGVIVVPVSAPVADATVPTDMPTAYVSGDVCAAIRALSAGAIKLQGKDQTYAVYTGTPGNSYGAQWEGCLANALKAAGWTQVLAGNTNWTPQGEQQAASALIASGKKVDAVFYDFETTPFAKALASAGETKVGVYPVANVQSDFIAFYKQQQDAGQAFPCLGPAGTAWAHDVGVAAAMEAWAGKTLPSPVEVPEPSFSCAQILASGAWSPGMPSDVTVGGLAVPADLLPVILATQ